MRRTTSWPPLRPIHWFELSLRWVWLTALPIAAGTRGVLSPALVLLLGGWAAYSLLLGLARLRGWGPDWLGWAAAGLDLALALAAIGLTGELSSPLWWSLLIGGATAGFQYGPGATLLISGIGAVIALGLGWWFAAPGALSLVPAILQSGVLLIAAAALGWLTERVRSLSDRITERQQIELQDVREQERSRARTVFRITSELNATLNYERVLDLALDLTARALSSGSPEDSLLVSALLLFENGGLGVASGRRLTTADQRAVLPGESGVVGRALTTGEPRIAHDPVRDPELQRLTALHTCRVAVCLPLAAGLESFGVLLFAHPSDEYFNAERVELLQAIGDQAVIALQNARLYRTLELEKERITEIQEEARRKLARDLHDGPTQSIAAIAMRTNFARRLLERDPRSAADELFKVEDLARRTTKEIRHMLFTLRPLILESQGLVAALLQLAEKMRETHGQDVAIEAQEKVANDLEIGKQGVVFYIAEEAVNNARKHAEAEHVWVRLKRDGDLFILEIEDDGVGFNVGAVDANYEQRGSLGMVNMRERTELVNGVLRISSAEGKGTRITVTVPLTEESADKLHRPGLTSG